MKWWRHMGEYNAETKTLSAFAGSVASPYTPDKDAILKGLRVIISGDGATSLTQGVKIRLTCTSFNPNMLEVFGQGSGLATAPQQNNQGMDFPIEQPVKAGVPITIEGQNLTADTPVGVLVQLMGQFEG